MRDQPNKEVAFQGINTGKFFLGLLILIIGLSYLGESLGFLSINVGYVFQHFWSILIIFIGLSMLTRTSRFWTWFGIAVAAGVLMMLFYVIADDSAFRELKRFEKIEITQAEGVSRARVKIDSQAAALRLEGGGGALLSGTFQSPFLNLRTKSEVENGLQHILLDTRDASGQSGWQYLGRNIGNFDLRLDPSIPIDLEINSTASDINLNLERIPARDIRVKSGASNMIVALGARLATSTLEIQSKASSVVVRVPESVGVRIRVSSHISSKYLPGFNPRGGGLYESDNYGRTGIHTDILVNSPIASLEVVWKQ